MKKYLITLISSGLFLTLFFIAVGTFWYQGQRRSDVLIADNVIKLAKIFNQIHNTCKIIDFEHQKNFIDFLNVKSFAGSEVGPMNLTYPKKWQGPYLLDNPTVQEKYYQVVRTKQGHFIVPGPGVKLFNGKVIGTDIILDENSDIKTMVQDEQFLNFRGRPLAVQIMGGAVPQVPEGDSAQDRMLRERIKQL